MRQGKMNRIQLMPTVGEHVASPATDDIESARYTPSISSAACALFGPMHYERKYAYPLLVWLHGPADDESQLKRIMPLVSLRNYVGIAPRGTQTAPAGGRSRPSFTWRQSEVDIALAEQRVFECIDAASERFHISAQRVFLGGFDCGGTMAFRLAMSHPERFAGVLSLGGCFPRGRAPLQRLPEARRIPLFVACGKESPKFDGKRACEDLRLFHSAGMNIALRIYPCGHEITSQMLSDMDRWIMEIIA